MLSLAAMRHKIRNSSEINSHDISENKKFVSLKEKYCGEMPKLVAERIMSKEKLEEARAKVKELKKSYKMKMVMD